ncbi:MAG: hypothetical protein BGO44_05820 [Legionella sp. 39-23]|nr:MAG: hypothetical protein BGO44_05820 [Legionella sp. 39-23]
MLLLSSLTFADPINQVSRLSYINGTVSFLPAGESQWVGVTLNRPLVTNDQIWADAGSLAEMQLSGAAVRMGSQTALKILNLNDEIAQFQLTQGTLVLSIKSINGQQAYEVDTPNLAFVITEPGYYRFDVIAEDDMTTVSVRMGEGTAYGQNASNTVDVGKSCSATGTNLDNFQCTTLGVALDDFESWSLDRDKVAGTVSTQYISPDTIGYEDLGNYGSWTQDQQYGPVWYPNNVATDWAPYQDGQWIWLGFWGWTWVDNQPWGFAPFHYGRWAHLRNRWCWVPGPIGAHPLYAPALTVFIGGNNPQFMINGGYGIGWFPLAPGEPYIPSYYVNHNYFIAINQSNTVIDVAFINNIYKNQNMIINYRNARIANAVTVVPSDDFINSRIVNNLRLHVPDQILFNAGKTHVAPIVPRAISILGGKAFTQVKPSAEIISRPIITKTQPSSATPSFSQVHPFLLKNAGRPLTPAEVQNINTGKPAIIKQSPPVTVHPVPGQTPGEQPVPNQTNPKARPGLNVQPTQNIQPGLNAPPGIKVQPGPKVRPRPTVQPSPNAQPQPYVRPGTNIQTKPYVQPGPNAQPQPYVRPGTNIQPKPYVQPGPNAQPQPYVQPGPNAQPQPYVRPGTNIQPKPYVQPGPNAQPQPYVRPGTNMQPKPYVQPGPNAQPQPYVRPGTNIQPKPYVQPGPNTQPQPYVRPGTNMQPKPYVHPGTSVQPSPVLKHEPMVHPAPAIQNQPMVQPQQVPHPVQHVKPQY